MLSALYISMVFSSENTGIDENKLLILME